MFADFVVAGIFHAIGGFICDLGKGETAGSTRSANTIDFGDPRRGGRGECVIVAVALCPICLAAQCLRSLCGEELLLARSSDEIPVPMSTNALVRQSLSR